MDNVILVALAGRSVLTDVNPDHFALFVNQSVDHILIKEKVRGTASVANGGSGTNIAHGLGYIPFCLVFAQESTGVWKKVFSAPVDGSGFGFKINATNLVLENNSGGTKTFAYYIFYDNIT